MKATHFICPILISWYLIDLFMRRSVLYSNRQEFISTLDCYLLPFYGSEWQVVGALYSSSLPLLRPSALAWSSVWQQLAFYVIEIRRYLGAGEASLSSCKVSCAFQRKLWVTLLSIVTCDAFCAAHLVYLRCQANCWYLVWEGPSWTAIWRSWT